MGHPFHFVRYKTEPDHAGRIDVDAVLKLARDAKPKMVLVGYSSYPRDLDYAAFKAVADDVGRMTIAYVSQIGGRPTSP